jgi:hypothetical protein
MSDEPDLAPDVRATLEAIRQRYLVASIPERTLAPAGLSGPPGLNAQLLKQRLDALIVCIQYELAFRRAGMVVPIKTPAEWDAYHRATALAGQAAAGDLAKAILARRLVLSDIKKFFRL